MDSPLIGKTHLEKYVVRKACLLEIDSRLKRSSLNLTRYCNRAILWQFMLLRVGG